MKFEKHLTTKQKVVGSSLKTGFVVDMMPRNTVMVTGCWILELKY